VIADEPHDAQDRSNHIRTNPLGRPEGLFQAEETVFPLKTDFTVDPVQGSTALLVQEIIGFAIPGKMDGMSLLLQVMTEMETPGCVPKPLTADNKKDLHGRIRFKEYASIFDEIVGESPRFFRESDCTVCVVFRNDDPCQDIDNDTSPEREEGHYRPDQPDHCGVNIKVFPKTGTDPPSIRYFRAA
jgi:hypothetical protein